MPLEVGERRLFPRQRLGAGVAGALAQNGAAARPRSWHPCLPLLRFAVLSVLWWQPGEWGVGPSSQHVTPPPSGPLAWAGLQGGCCEVDTPGQVSVKHCLHPHPTPCK